MKHAYIDKAGYLEGNTRVTGDALTLDGARASVSDLTARGYMVHNSREAALDALAHDAAAKPTASAADDPARRSFIAEAKSAGVAGPHLAKLADLFPTLKTATLRGLAIEAALEGQRGAKVNAWRDSILTSDEGKARPAAASRLVSLSTEMSMPLADARLVLRGLPLEAPRATSTPSTPARSARVESFEADRRAERMAEIAAAGAQMRAAKFGGEANTKDAAAWRYASEVARLNGLALSQAARQLGLKF